MKTCQNHPDREAFSICCGCGKDYCKDCLDEGVEYYYCKNPECQKLFYLDLPASKISDLVVCPECNEELEVTDEERNTGKVHCPDCEIVIDFNSDPPLISKKEMYSELLSTFNQGDIGKIKSLLDDAGFEFKVLGENFLSVDPLIQPVTFYVTESRKEDAVELLKNVDLNIWGTSAKNIDDTDSNEVG
jgi:uncharacterized protein YbaR (Trm112 family)